MTKEKKTVNAVKEKETKEKEGNAQITNRLDNGVPSAKKRRKKRNK